MLENRSIRGQDDLVTCNHCGAEGVLQSIFCDVCETGDFCTEEEYKGPNPYGWCEKCGLKGYL